VFWGVYNSFIINHLLGDIMDNTDEKKEQTSEDSEPATEDSEDEERKEEKKSSESSESDANEPSVKASSNIKTNTVSDMDAISLTAPPAASTDAPASDAPATEVPAVTEEMEVPSQAPTGGKAFLELDKETQERMKELEEAERLAEAEAEEAMDVGIFAVKTSIGHEKMVANWLAQRVRKRKAPIYAILSPPKLRGYLLLEGIKNKEALQDLIKGVQHARSVVDGVTQLDEIEHFLTPKPLVSGIEEGDVVEIIAGPFKGEKAKVTQIDESKEEITVELFEAMVSIPVTIRGDHVRILEKESK
jgi:transcriptional antiterminator NusG